MNTDYMLVRHAGEYFVHLVKIRLGCTFSSTAQLANLQLLDIAAAGPMFLSLDRGSNELSLPPRYPSNILPFNLQFPRYKYQCHRLILLSLVLSATSFFLNSRSPARGFSFVPKCDLKLVGV